MDSSHPLRRLAADPTSLSVETLRKLSDDYPYTPLPALALLSYHRDSLTEAEINKLQLHLALISGDKEALYKLLGHNHDLYPAEETQSQASTDTAIDTFFANYGSADPAETELLERMIFNPVPDYAEFLLREDGADLSDDPFPINFGVNHKAAPMPEKEIAPPPLPVAEIPAEKTVPEKAPGKTAAPPADDTLLSESLAKIFIKQGRYERAFEIISNLSLNYPKKSIYFADQLRFLQKLIKIKQAANGQQH